MILNVNNQGSMNVDVFTAILLFLFTVLGEIQINDDDNVHVQLQELRLGQ